MNLKIRIHMFVRKAVFGKRGDPSFPEILIRRILYPENRYLKMGFGSIEVTPEIPHYGAPLSCSLLNSMYEYTTV